MGTRISNNIGAYIFILLVMCIGAYFCTRATKVTTQDVDTVNRHLNMPLDKATIWLKEDIFETAVNKSNWAKVELSPFSSAIKIGPKGDVNTYKFNVDLDDVRILADISEEHKFEIDDNYVLLPTDNNTVLVPTWIVYKLAEDNCFEGK